MTLPSGAAAELAPPPSGSADRGLVVIPDIMGLRPLFDDHCARLAETTGWSVCSFEPFADHPHMELAERLQSVGDLSDDRVMSDAVDAAAGTGAERVAVIGFCMGGMYTLKAAGTGRFDRAVSFYGMIRIPEQWRSPSQGEPLEALARPDVCPVLAVIGTADPWTPPADVDALEAAGATVARYEGADHGFVHDPARPAHRADDAADAWARALAFLAAD